jgi:hypothetical protein
VFDTWPVQQKLNKAYNMASRKVKEGYWDVGLFFFLVSDFKLNQNLKNNV